MTSRVGRKGQVLTPKALRDPLGIAPGDEVTVTPYHDGALVQPVRRRASLRGMFAGSDLPGELERDRREELRREEWS